LGSRSGFVYDNAQIGFFEINLVAVGRLARILPDHERRPHFAGPAAAAILKHLEAHKFLVPDKSERRALRITDAGNARLGIGAGVDLLAS
jgi:hypothetical protein